MGAPGLGAEVFSALFVTFGEAGFGAEDCEEEAFDAAVFFSAVFFSAGFFSLLVAVFFVEGASAGPFDP